MLDKLHIQDNSFSHAYTSSWYNRSKLFEWVRNQHHSSDYIVITDLREVDNFKNKKVYGWIIEPPHILPYQYEFAKNNFSKFEKIFTYDEDLLKLSKIFEFLPIGGCWIDEDDRKIYQKSKLICAISSNKKITNLHNFRHEVIKKFPEIDAYGYGYRKVEKKIDVLKDYMFCVAIENQEKNYLFTEKIIDCLLTGTIPIYLGCPSINKFFNPEGILKFNTIEDLKEIMESISSDLYLQKKDFILDNFEKAKNYVLADDFIYNFLKNEW